MGTYVPPSHNPASDKHPNRISFFLNKIKTKWPTSTESWWL